MNSRVILSCLCAVFWLCTLPMSAADCYTFPKYPELLKLAAVEGEILLEFDLVAGVPRNVVVTETDMTARAQRAEDSKFRLEKYPQITRPLIDCLEGWRFEKSRDQKVTVALEFRINYVEEYREDARDWTRFTVLKLHDGIPIRILIEATGGFINE